MNCTIKKNIMKVIFCIIFCSIAILQNAELITQKINVENAIRDKVNVTIAKLLDQSQYVIIVNARMDVKAFSMNENSNAKGSQTNYYSPIPGLLPTVPQNIKKPSSDTFQYSTDKYLLYGLDVAIYLDEQIIDGGLKQNISRLVNDAIPEIEDCDDCIRFETMSMGGSSSSSYQDLLNRIEELETERRSAEADLMNWKFDQLETQLSLSQEREKSRELSDLIRLEKLEKIEFEYRKKQDSLYVLTSINLNEAIQGRIQSESDLNDKLIDIIKSGMDNNADKDIIGGGSDPDINRGASGSDDLLLWIAFAVVVLLLGALIFLVLKNKQPIYLKPKKINGENQNITPNDNMSSAISVNKQAPSQTQAEEELDLTQTNANENHDVMRSELKSLRQSAVAMSVSQKDGANQIVQDWLDSNDESADSIKPSNDNAEEKS